MKSVFARFFATATAAFITLGSANAAEDSRYYEMRIYYAPEGKLNDLHARFRDHTVKLFEKHGMVNIGYWVPEGENKENKLAYILAYPSKEARDKSWKDFMADPDWQKAWKASEVNGKLVAKAESIFLKATDYTPEIKASQAAPRVFELRTYTAAPGRLANLNKRFRDHTVKLFAKHGMTNFGYWTQVDKDNTLIYLLAHKSRDAARASFSAFGQDKDWQAARKASEEEAGGGLTAQGGVKSEFWVATDYSPTK